MFRVLCAQLISSFPLFFYCVGAHRALHSFPTRRSSDLRGRSGWRRSTPNRRKAAPRSPAPSCARRSSPRSEEHTSELQSLRHLVCRLLLEKKNTTKLTDTDAATTRATTSAKRAQGARAN